MAIVSLEFASSSVGVSTSPQDSPPTMQWMEQQPGVGVFLYIYSEIQSEENGILISYSIGTE